MTSLKWKPPRVEWHLPSSTPRWHCVGWALRPSTSCSSLSKPEASSECDKRQLRRPRCLQGMTQATTVQPNMALCVCCRHVVRLGEPDSENSCRELTLSKEDRVRWHVPIPIARRGHQCFREKRFQDKVTNLELDVEHCYTEGGAREEFGLVQGGISATEGLGGASRLKLIFL